MRNDTTITAGRTAARTGTTFDMSDLITNGTATKLPNMFLPPDHPAMQVISLNEATMPGDVLGVSPRHPPVTEPIEARMANIIRERSLDFVGQVDDFLKRPAYSRMPTRNRAFLDVPTFRRAICYAFGDQWTRLAMTSNEFKQICIKNLRNDAAAASTSSQSIGQPEPLVLWQPFAYSLMQMADGDKYKIKLRGELDACAPATHAPTACACADVVSPGYTLFINLYVSPAAARKRRYSSSRSWTRRPQRPSMRWELERTWAARRAAPCPSRGTRRWRGFGSRRQRRRRKT